MRGLAESAGYLLKRGVGTADGIGKEVSLARCADKTGESEPHEETEQKEKETKQ